MKHNIVFKFIAVLLCAVSLMGTAGSAVGIFVMTELDLYEKTVEQVREEQLTRNGEYYAGEAALRYASLNLGSCPEELVDNHYGRWFDEYYVSGKYSYSLLDGEGNELYRYGEVSDVTASYQYPVSGQYLHMVSKETEQERNLRIQEQVASYSANFTIGADAYVMDALPPDGVHVAYASFCDENGVVVYAVYDDVNGVGFLRYNAAGQVVFSGSKQMGNPDLTQEIVSGAYFQALDGSVVYEATWSEGVGTVYLGENGRLQFASGNLEHVERTAPVQETQPEQTQAAPAELVPVYYAAFYDEKDEKVYRVRGSRGVGFLSLDPEGRLVYRGFQKEQEQLPEGITLTGAYFCDEEDNILYELYAEDSIGSISYTENGQLIFTTAAPAENFDPAELMSASREAREVSVPATEETAAAEETVVQQPSSASNIPDATQSSPASAALINGKPLEEYQLEQESYYDEALDEMLYVSYVRVPMPEYTVELRLAPGALGMDAEYQLLMLLRSIGGYLLPALAVCLLLFAICAVYLCCAAGRKPGSEEVHAGGLNCLPLDLYTGLAFLGVACACAVGVELAWYRLNQNFLFSCMLAVGMIFAACLLTVAYCFAFAAQVKTPGGYWWRNTLCARAILLFMHFGVWLERFLSNYGFPQLGRMLRWLWRTSVKLVLGCFRLWQRFADSFLRNFRRFGRWVYHRLHRFLSLLPITWQWMLGGCVLIFIAAVFVNGAVSPTVGLLALIVCFAIVFYVSHCFGVLSENTKRMSKGDLNTKVEEKLLLGCFRDFAGDLNDLADVAVIAAQKQLKSERMKTELITNVSHDIKTPLTSIINYVDLLQKPHDEAQGQQYLEVLSRQSLRLKKLIDDLMEMSKASTGNMAVEITTVDAIESVNQALGEFSDKLAAAQLLPVFRYSGQRVSMMADGKLVWRILSNVLSNAVKYAMPGTRLYIDLMELEGKVVISLKNISREELNVDAEELMERFVRGDDSRNTEGSGLGLNIAKSLMELQKGQLQLMVDGDLFKVTLIFPGV